MKNNHIYRFLTLMLFLGIVFQSCEKDFDLSEPEDALEVTTTKSSLARKEINSKGAKKLKNPYALKNMQKALENIKKRLGTKEIKINGNNALRLEEGVQDFELSTSHYYVLLSPQNTEQEALIKEDPNIHVFDYPLDYEFTDEYLDSRTPDTDSIPQYYTSIVLGQELPTGVPYQILEELYIPEEDPFFDELSYARTTSAETRQGEIGSGEDLLRHLLMEAYTLTDNQDELLPEGDTTTAFWIFGSKWYPSGNLKLWDDNAGSSTTTTKTFSHYEYYYCDTGEPAPDPNGGLDPYARIDPIDDNVCKRAIYTYTTNTVQGKYVPLEGAQVLMRQWFTIRQGITDANGHFSTGSVRGNARYIIQWERYHYSIRNGSLFQAETRGPKTDNSWNYSIKDGEKEFFGTIHRSAHHYYYKDIKGLKRPPTNSFWKPQMKIAAHNKENDEINGNHQKDLRIFGIVPRLNIYNPQNQTQEIYATTIHELAHASHWELRKNDWNDNNLESKVKESWARGVEWELTRMVYPSSTYKGRFWNTSQSDYTLVVADMIDGIGYNSENHGFFDTRDGVSGYTIKQIEDVLSYTSSWNNWRDNIKNNYNNSTKNNLDKLFNAYE